MGRTETTNPRQGAHQGERPCYANSALAPTAASAHPKGGGMGGGFGGFHHHHFGPGFGIGYIGGGYGDDGCYVTRRVPTPFGFRWRTVNVCGY